MACHAPGVFSDHALTQMGFEILNIFKQLDGDPNMDPLIERVNRMVIEMRKMGAKLDENDDKINALEDQLVTAGILIENANRRSQDLESAIRLARQERNELLEDLERSWEEDVSRVRLELANVSSQKELLTHCLKAAKEDLQLLECEKREMEESLRAELEEALSRQATPVLRDHVMGDSADDEARSCDDDNSWVARNNKEGVKEENVGLDEKSARLIQHNKELLKYIDDLLAANRIFQCRFSSLRMNKDHRSLVGNESLFSSEQSLRQELAAAAKADISFNITERSRLSAVCLTNHTDHRETCGDGHGSTPLRLNTNLKQENGLCCECGLRLPGNLSLNPIYENSTTKRSKSRVIDILFFCGFCILLDIVCFAYLGVHILSIDPPKSQTPRTAVF